jgi:RND family efflux transporter MFP subunit
MTRLGPKAVLPVVVLAAAVLGAVVMVAARPRVEMRALEAHPPLVRVVGVAMRPLRLRVRTHGTVVPRTESHLVAEVGGRVTWVSPALASGGFFAAAEPLVRLDPSDHALRLARAEAALASAQSQARLAARNRARSAELAREGLVASTQREDAEHAAAAAAAGLRDAEALLAQARRDLERTTLEAPFDGRVREEHVDPGQFVERGTRLATLYAVDYAEVRLPVPDADLAFLDLALAHRGDRVSARGPGVVLTARFAGGEHRWKARIVRTEGELDARSRVVWAVARVDDPYGDRAGGDRRPPLAVGMFVEAEIIGRTVPEAVVLPRGALRGPDRVLVVDAGDRLRERRVNVLRTEGDRAIVSDGLRAGERVCVSPLEASAEGLPVRPVAEAAS